MLPRECAMTHGGPTANPKAGPNLTGATGGWSPEKNHSLLYPLEYPGDNGNPEHTCMSYVCTPTAIQYSCGFLVGKGVKDNGGIS